MNAEITTLDPVTSAAQAKTILAKEGVRCSLITLAPDEETPLREVRDVEKHILFVVDGEATVRLGHVNTMLAKDAALLIAKGKAHLIAAGASGAKLLRVDIPPRQVVTPQILTMAR